MTTLVVDRDPTPNGFNDSQRKTWHWQTSFEIDHQIYQPIKLIGRGGYGIVCSSLNFQTKQIVAIKKIHNVFQNRIHALRTLRELTILTHIKHPNLISLKDVLIPIHSIKSDFDDVYLVYELMDIDLRRIIKSSMPISEYHSKYFLFQLLCGLEHLHSANILHRDLKPENLLVNTNCDLKICDFGLSRGNGQSMTEYVVARWYRAPELLLCCDKYGTSIDVWSVGCIFAEILGRETLFPGKDYLNQLNTIIDVLGSPCEADTEFINNPRSINYIKSLPFANGVHFSRLYPHADPLAIDLLQRMLMFDPTKRITVKEALQHPYMSGLYDPDSNPPAKVTVSLDIDDNLEEHMIREMMVNEMLHFHPELEA